MVNPDSIPRYAQPMDAEPPLRTCGGCRFYKELRVRNDADRSVHCVGACVYEVFHARTPDELAVADVSWVEPDDEACGDWEVAS